MFLAFRKSCLMKNNKNLIFFQVFRPEMKLNRSSREPGGQASNWRPPGTGSDPPSRPEVDFSRQNTNIDRIQNKNKSETTKLVLQKPPSDKVFKQKNEKQISKTDSNRISGNADGVKRLRRHRLVVRLKMSEIIFSIFVLVSASFVLLATAQTVEGNSILKRLQCSEQQEIDPLFRSRFSAFHGFCVLFF